VRPFAAYLHEGQPFQVEHYILPVTERTDQSFITNMLDLAAPFIACYILIFYISAPQSCLSKAHTLS
jgi:hypothetical protein